GEHDQPPDAPQVIQERTQPLAGEDLGGLLPAGVAGLQGGPQRADPPVVLLRPDLPRARPRDLDPERVALTAQQAGPVPRAREIRAGQIDPSEQRRVLGQARLDLLQVRWPAGELPIFRLERPLELDVLAVEGIALPSEPFQPTVIVLGGPRPA